MRPRAPLIHQKKPLQIQSVETTEGRHERWCNISFACFLVVEPCSVRQSSNSMPQLSQGCVGYLKAVPRLKLVQFSNGKYLNTRGEKEAQNESYHHFFTQCSRFLPPQLVWSCCQCSSDAIFFSMLHVYRQIMWTQQCVVIMSFQRITTIAEHCEG